MPQLLPNPAPFEDYRVYGPYQDRKQQRQIVVLVSGIHRTTMSYARYLLSIRFGAVPDRDIEADHVDDDRTNDEPGNIQPLLRIENVRKNRPQPAIAHLVCPGCDKPFARLRRQTHLVKGGNPSSCSRKCARAVQFGRGAVAELVQAPDS